MLVVDFENKVIEADNHVIETYRTCEEKYRLMLHEHWVPQGGAPALAFGIAMHEARAQYKKYLMHDPTNAMKVFTIEAALKVGLDTWEREMPQDMKDITKIDDKRGKANFERLFRGYVAKFGNQDYKPVQVEVPGKKFLGLTPEGWTFNYVYTIDEIVEHRGRKWPLEFKTSSGFSPPDTNFFKGFNNKSSITGYIWACEEHFGYDIGGAIIHAMWVHAEPKATSRSRFTLPDYYKMDYSYRDDDQINEWKCNTLLTGDDIVRSMRENRWKRADGNPCMLYNGCAMKNVCEATPKARQALLEMDFEKREWNPWGRVDGEIA